MSTVTRSTIGAIALKEIADCPMKLSVPQWRSVERMLINAMISALAEAGDEVEPRRAGGDAIGADLVWLSLGEGTAIGIDRQVALSLDRKGFFRLYRKHVYGASRADANAWAEDQLRIRAAAYREAEYAAL